MLFLTDEEVELFATILKNKMYYNDKCYKIIRATNEGYYVKEMEHG